MQIFLLLFIVTFVVTLWGRRKYRTIYDAELKNVMRSGMTGAGLAQSILAKARIEDVEIVMGKGLFADFYDPDRKRLSLAPQHFNGSTFTALGIAAHEAGHALQAKAGHVPLQWRISAIRSTIFLSVPLAALGLIMLIVPGMGRMGLMVILAGWSMIAAYNIFTVPVELDASERSKRVLSEIKPFRNLDERIGVERVMRAASAAYLDGFFTVISWVGSWMLPAAK